jgi:hypothetical protein
LLSSAGQFTTSSKFGDCAVAGDVFIKKRPSGATVVAAENPSARVYKWVLAPAVASAMHIHDRPYLIVAATSMHLRMSDPAGKSLAEEVKPGDFHWVDSSVEHMLVNESASEGEIVEIELK